MRGPEKITFSDIPDSHRLHVLLGICNCYPQSHLTRQEELRGYSVAETACYGAWNVVLLDFSLKRELTVKEMTPLQIGMWLLERE